MKADWKKLIGIGLGILLLWLSLSFTFPFSYGAHGDKMIIHISHRVGVFPLVLDSTVYQNSLEQDFRISKFKYYIGNIVLKQSNGVEFKSHDYFLVNEEDKSSKHLVLADVPNRDYVSLEFIVGVDSLHNSSGAQSGALDPVNAMFWAWNTGYIFLKLEGSAAPSKSPGHLFEYHIGGYRQPNNCIRKIKLDLDNRLQQKQADGIINLTVDVSELLKTPLDIDFGKLSSVTDFRNAASVADNYQDMFSILKRVEKN